MSFFQVKEEDDDPDWKREGRRRERWKMANIISFLGLLKNYPELYKRKSRQNHGVIMLNELKSLSSLLGDCMAHQLPLNDLDTLQRRIANVKAQFSNAMGTYKKNIRQGVVFDKPSLRWFKEASFLDTSGLLEMSLKPVPTFSISVCTIIEIIVVFQEVRVARMKPSSFLTHLEPAQSSRTTQNGLEMNSTTASNSISYSQNTLVSIKQEDDVIHISDDEDYVEDLKATDLSPQSNLSESVPLLSTERSTQVDDNLWVSSPNPSMRYFLAFLDYTKVRSESYSGRDKRRIMDVITMTMNMIDDQREVLLESEP